ncbi:MAG: hypothetical protein EBV03_11150 [Proteobacteria bacterium]|nr:hypothetical protein [Pseudomonadota bacterium]
MVSSISSLAGSQTAQGVSNADNRLRKAIANIVTGRKTEDVAKLSIATQLQSVTSGLRQASSNLALGSSLSQVADGGVQQIQAALGQLQDIASQASNPALNDANRAQLNDVFKQTLQGINQLARSTSFNGQNVLDGNLSGSNALSLGGLLGSDDGLDTALSIGNLSADSLLGSINVLTPEAAGQATTAISQALNQITATRTNIGAFSQAVNFAAANVESAIFNQEAAQAVLSDTDIAAESTESSLAQVQRNAAIALAAQGNRLSPQLLQLVG